MAIDGLGVRITILIYLCKYLEGCVELFKIYLIIHDVRHFEVCQWAQEQEKGILNSALLLDKAQLCKRYITEHTQEIAKNQRNVEKSPKSLDAVCQNTPMVISKVADMALST